MGFEQFLTEAAQIKDTSLQISDMKIPQDVKKWRPPKSKQSGRGKQPCRYCRQTGTREESKNCPAYGKKCMKCQKFNHFSSVCKSKGPPNSKKWQEQRPNHNPPENPGHKRCIKKTTEEEEDADNSKSSDDEFFCQAVRRLKQAKKIKAAGEDRTVSVEDVDVRAEPDNGAEVNVLDEHQFKALTNRSSMKLTLQPSRVSYL